MTRYIYSSSLPYLHLLIICQLIEQISESTGHGAVGEFPAGDFSVSAERDTVFTRGSGFGNRPSANEFFADWLWTGVDENLFDSILE